MAYPVVQTTNTSVSGGTVTSHPVSMPTSIVVGDLLIVSACFASSTAVTVPAGWTTVSNNLNGSTRLIIVKRIATGSDSLTFTTGVGAESAHVAYRAYSNDTTLSAGTAATGTSTAPNSPNLDNGSSQEFMWIVSMAWGSTPTLSSYPTNYTSNQITATEGNAQIVMATYNATASSEDPSAFTLSASTPWVAQTLSIDEQSVVTGSFSLITQSSEIFQPAIDFAADATFPIIEMSNQVFQPSATVSTATRYTNKTKPSTVWTNKPKP